MKILIDIGHPAHVHYFKNFIKIMQNNGHTVFVIAREKQIILRLLEIYKIQFIGRGKGKNTNIGRVLYFIKANLMLLKYTIRFKPNIFLSQGGIYTSLVSVIFRKPNLVLEDTESCRNAV